MWLLYALLNPVVDASRNVFSKRASKNVDPLLITWFNNLIPAICFSPVLFLAEMRFSGTFFLAVTVSGLSNIAAAILYHRAISKGDISEVVPMLSFTPLFLLITSPFLLNEYPDLSGYIGIFLIIIGSYLLNVGGLKENPWRPFKALVTNKGTRYMLIVAVVWSISANFDKIGIRASGVWQYVFFVNLFVITGTSLFLFGKRKFSLPDIKSEKKNLLLVGLLTTLGFFLHMTALSLALVAYVIALKRTAGMISVGLGHFFLNEQNIKKRFLGASIMFAGVVAIVIF